MSGAQAVLQRPARAQVLAWATHRAAVPEEGWDRQVRTVGFTEAKRTNVLFS